jgi:hypothetical protein
MKTKFSLYILAFLVVFVPSVCFGVNTTYWEQRTSSDFSAGRKENLTITNQGEVMLSPIVTEIGDTTDLYYWTMAKDNDGNIFIGSGNGGKIYRMDKSGKTTILFDSPEISIVSLALHKNYLYAGSAPSGLIYRMPKDNGAKVEVFYRTDGEYVWSMLFDDRGNLYAGTGRGGIIYKIDTDGNGDIFYDSKETHIMSLLHHNDYIYAGGAGNGIIYKIAMDGTPSVVYDSPESEIHTLLASEEGKLYAASVPVTYLEAPVTEPRQQNSQEQTPPPPIEGAERTSYKQSILYEVDEKGIVTPIWHCPETLILSLMFDDDGDILVGTGSRGKIFKIDPESRDWAELVQIKDSQIMDMMKLKSGKILISTGNLAHIYEFTSDYSSEGTLESDIYDAQHRATWGKLIWNGEVPQGTGIKFETRVGESEKPDDVWSEWTALGENGKIQHDSARFIQWKATFSTTNSKKTPELETVKIASLPYNLPPIVLAVSVYTSGQEVLGADKDGKNSNGSGSSGSGSEEKELGPNLAVAKWKAVDENNDKLHYYIHFRGENEENWKLLKDKTSESEFTWNTESFPDGLYQLNVVASDSSDNPMDIAKTDERESNWFEIDNTSPTVSDIQVSNISDGNYEIKAILEDSANEIRAAEYSIDAKDWHTIFPDDNIYDQKRETVSISASNLSEGEHIVVIRVKDMAQNIGAGKKVFYVE